MVTLERGNNLRRCKRGEDARKGDIPRFWTPCRTRYKSAPVSFWEPAGRGSSANRSTLDRIFLRSVLGITCRSLNTDSLNRISYPAIVPQLFDHLGIADDRFAGPLLVGGDVVRILREGILDRLVDQGGNGFRGFDGFELQRLVQRGLEVDGRFWVFSMVAPPGQTL